MDDYEKQIIRFCTDLSVKMIDKYRRGKLEHGGEPTNINCEKEVNQEVLDILNYFCIHKVNECDPGGFIKIGGTD